MCLLYNDSYFPLSYLLCMFVQPVGKTERILIDVKIKPAQAGKHTSRRHGDIGMGWQICFYRVWLHLTWFAFGYGGHLLLVLV